MGLLLAPVHKTFRVRQHREPFRGPELRYVHPAGTRPRNGPSTCHCGYGCNPRAVQWDLSEQKRITGVVVKSTV